MGLINTLQNVYESRAKEFAELELREEVRNGTLPTTNDRAYKKGFINATLIHNGFGAKVSSTFVGACIILGISSLYNGYNNECKRYLTLENQAKQQRIIDFYQKHGIIPEGVSSAYLDLRTQLWQNDVEKVK